MAVRIQFDSNHNPIQPTIVLATRGGRKLGRIPAVNVVFKDNMSNGCEMSFKVYKEGCAIWERITDFKLVWVREWNRFFEIEVEVSDDGSVSKSVTASSLGSAELSQINLYDSEINTEDDIARDDYRPTVFYNPDDSSVSLLNRLLEKAPHYHIGHVDDSLKSIQRTFSFDNKSIEDAFNEVCEEIGCLITADCFVDEEGNFAREVNAYDLKAHCLECGKRGDFTDTCDSCGSTNISNGYGKDTSIFVSTENLADNIKYSTDNGSVKNCFKMEAGDDLMTAAVVSCNPNGSAYLWHITDDVKEDMSDGLVKKLEEYDWLYAYYQKEHTVTIPDTLLNAYNALIEKYSAYTSDYKKAVENIVGYQTIMERYFDAIDFGIYLTSGLMPAPDMAETSAGDQIRIIQEALLSPVSVRNIETCSASTAESAVLGMAKAVADSRYQIRVSESTYADKTWSGIIQVTNTSNEDDAATSARLSCKVNDDYARYVKQKILKTMKRSTDDATSIDAMFKLSDEKFSAELQKYCLSRLSALRDICQSCVDILIEQGISDDSKWAYKDDDLYQSLYLPYYNKLQILESEIQLREQEIAVITGSYDADGNLIADGMKSFLQSEKDMIQKSLNFDDYLGKEYLLEFAAYRREDTYQNSNYISDGLNNAELFEMAQRFIQVAQSEIVKSATLQHSITATLKNLLAMKEFSIIVDNFEIGNWIRVRIDNKLFKLRLIQYEIDFDNFDNISVEFSDVIVSGGVVSDVESIISKATSMATSYDYVARQAKQGDKGNSQLLDWVNRGLDLTKLRIIDSAENQNISWDSHGLLCKEYLPILGRYDDKQLKLISRGLYLTDDNWKTSKAGIGDFTFWNPKTGKMEESYGVIADVIVGNIILSEEVGIYNQKNSVTMDENGLVITAFKDDERSSVVFNVRKKVIDADGNAKYYDEMYLDDDGNLVINGNVRINSQANPGSTGTLDDLNKDISDIQNRIDGFNGLFFYIRYSEMADGSNMTEHPNEKSAYLGTCNTDEKTAPEDPTRYTWVKIKGEKGSQGISGTSSYLHIRYSDDGKTFSGNGGLDSGDWIGTCISESETAPDDFAQYKWSKFNGTDGINTAYVMLYKRYEVTPPRITADLEYSFETGKLTGTMNGWSQTMPASNGLPCYVIHAMAASQQLTDTIAASEWTEPTKIVEDGLPGANGYSTATLFLYKRSSEKVSVDWKDTLTYSFSLKKLTSIPSGWAASIPDGELPLYVTAATAASTTVTDTVTPEEWSEPVLLSKNGADGTDGTNGLNSATVFLYKRSTFEPSTPSNDTTYTFATGSLSEVDGWSMDIPSGTEPCYVIHATAVSSADIDIIKSSEWSDPVVLVQNGNDGTNGHNTASVYLYKRSATAVSVDWTEVLTYVFSSKLLRAVPAGWSQTIPFGSDPIYVTMAGAYSDTNTDDIEANEWCEPVILAQNGTDGKDGEDGTSAHFYVRYSAKSDGSNMTQTPTNATYYIGVCSTESDTAPTDSSLYQWSKFRGNDGIPGAAGANGKTQYLHIKYSDDGESFTGNDGEDLGEYIGTLVDFESEDSMDFSAYKWKKFSGDLSADLEEIQKRIDQSADAIYDNINQKENAIYGKIDSETSDIRGSITEQINVIQDSIKKSYDEVIGEAKSILESHTAELGQYMSFGDSGLTLGASSSSFKTVIDNTGMYFKEGDAIVSYVKNNQLHIPNAVIESTMMLGKFFFSPRSDGGVSLVWQE